MAYQASRVLSAKVFRKLHRFARAWRTLEDAEMARAHTAANRTSDGSYMVA